LPRRTDAYILGKQLLRSGTSVAANYHAACRARSAPEFVGKLGIMQEEGDETVFWLELLGDTGIVNPARLQPLIVEANELTAIATAARKTTESRFQLRKQTSGA
jgi:four helix bundle protein